jgi:hypothetical protein
MSTSLGGELQSLTTQLKVALEERAAAQIEVSRLKHHQEMQDGDRFTHRNEYLPYERLRIQLEEAEGKAELLHRSSYPKATESSSHAAVRSDPEVVRLKLALLELEERELKQRKADPDDDLSEQLLKAQERLIKRRPIPYSAPYRTLLSCPPHIRISPTPSTWT